MRPSGAGSESYNDKSSALISFKKEESSFLKKRSKRLLFLCANLIVRLCSEASFPVVSLIGKGEQLPKNSYFLGKTTRHSDLHRSLEKKNLLSYALRSVAK
jgi:hypothetical protein